MSAPAVALQPVPRCGERLPIADLPRAAESVFTREAIAAGRVRRVLGRRPT